MKNIKKIIALLSFIVVFLIFYIVSTIGLFMGASGRDVLNNNDFHFNSSVEDCRQTVTLYLKPALKELGITKDEQIEDFTIITLSMIQVHYDNNVSIGTDPMNIYNHSSHKKCSMCINSCINKSHSVMVGVKYFCKNLQNENVTKITEEEKIKSALGSYYNSINPNIIKLSSTDYADRVWNYYTTYISENLNFSYSGSNDLVKLALEFASRKESGARFQKKYGYDRSAAWCTLFCMYCADEVGLKRSVAPLHPYVPTVVKNFEAKGQYKSATSGYIPKPGDFIILYGHGHIGIVWKVVGNTVYTIEGNRLWGGKYTCATSFVYTYSDTSITSADGYCTYKRK